jgi:hypothetical protein
MKVAVTPKGVNSGCPGSVYDDVGRRLKRLEQQDG